MWRYLFECSLLLAQLEVQEKLLILVLAAPAALVVLAVELRSVAALEAAERIALEAAESLVVALQVVG